MTCKRRKFSFEYLGEIEEKLSASYELSRSLRKPEDSYLSNTFLKHLDNDYFTGILDECDSKQRVNFYELMKLAGSC